MSKNAATSVVTGPSDLHERGCSESSCSPGYTFSPSTHRHAASEVKSRQEEKFMARDGYPHLIPRVRG